MAKPRVHEIAKELGVPSKDLIAKLNELGEYVNPKTNSVQLNEIAKSTPTRSGREYAVQPPMLTAMKGRCCAMRTEPSVTAITRSARSSGVGFPVSLIALHTERLVALSGTRQH